MEYESNENTFIRPREFAFKKEHFLRVKDKLYNYAGIVLADHKQDMVYNRLVKRLRELKYDCFDDYLQYLDSEPAEFTQFINTMTTNLTSFFRERHHFEFLDEIILPDIAQQEVGKLRIWSAGCSFGEETYSIAMTLLDSAVDVSSWDVRLLATDIDSKVLTSATEGVYEQERVEFLSHAQLHNWFLKGVGDQSGQVKVRQVLQDMITFRYLNLMEEWPMTGPFDLIFCRNVMIYFDSEAKEKLLDRMADLLKPDGYLFIGHSEAMPRHGKRYRLIGKTIYQKVY
jgi:chemotaxis protein methyltransferase CheR